MERAFKDVTGRAGHQNRTRCINPFNGQRPTVEDHFGPVMRLAPPYRRYERGAGPRPASRCLTRPALPNLEMQAVRPHNLKELHIDAIRKQVVVF